MTVLANVGILVLIRRQFPTSEHASARVGQLGTVLIAARCIAFFFKSQLPSALSLVLPNTLIMLGLAIYWYSVQLLCRVSVKPSLLLAPVVIATTGVYLFQISYPDTWMRILIVALAWMFLIFGTATTLHRQSSLDFPSSQRALTWLFYAVGFFTLLRLLYYFQINLSPDFDVTDNSNVANWLSPLLALALPILVSTAFLLLCYERARRKSERQTQALSYISHDLRAPAATIKGYANLLRPSASSDQVDHLETIERSTDYQLSLANELLDYATQELQPLVVKAVATDLQALVENLSAQGRALCHQQVTSLFST